jgi:hypothetical protein
MPHWLVLTPPDPAALAPLCLVVFLFGGNPRIKTPLPSLGEGLGERARLVGFTNRIWDRYLEQNGFLPPGEFPPTPFRVGAKLLRS